MTESVHSELSSDITVEEAAKILDELASVEPRPTWMSYVHSIQDLAPKAHKDASLPDTWKAIQYAFGYILELQDQNGRPRVALSPRDDFGDEHWPPEIGQVESPIRQIWDELARLVKDPLPRARLQHVCWEARSPDPYQRAKDASVAYVQCGSTGTDNERIEYLAAAIRLARAINNSELLQSGYDAMVGFINEALANDSPRWIIIRALELLTQEGSLRERVGNLARQLAQLSPTLQLADRAFALARACLPELESDLWRDQVERHLAEADASEVSMLTSHHLHEALLIAERSGAPDIRDKVSARLQEVSRQDLGMHRFAATSYVFHEAVERLIDAQTEGEDWARSLERWAQFGPHTGSVEWHEDQVRQLYELAPLQALFSSVLLGADQLPLYRPVTAADRFLVDVVRNQVISLQNMLPYVTQALLEIAVRHGVPKTSDLYRYLLTWPGLDEPTASVGALALSRFWGGDYDGAFYTTLPQIEGQARRLVLETNIGIYRTQRDRRPGQYVGLDALITLLGDTHNLSSNWRRYYEVALTHPAGLRLRHDSMHGFLGVQSARSAALVLHMLLHLGTLERNLGAQDGSTKTAAPNDVPPE